MSTTKLNGLNTALGKGGTGLYPGGDTKSLYSYLGILGAIWAPPQADATAMAAMALVDLSTGMQCLQLDTGYVWRYDAESEATDTTSKAAIAVTAGGAWLRGDKRIHVKVAIAFGTANNAVLFTVPDGLKLALSRAWWEVTTGFTGGTSSAIGLSSSNSAYSTAGDLLGGASGDLAATLVAGQIGGTIGAKFGSNGVVVLSAADTVKFNRIASVYTAGAGFVHLVFDVVS